MIICYNSTTVNVWSVSFQLWKQWEDVSFGAKLSGICRSVQFICFILFFFLLRFSQIFLDYIWIFFVIFFNEFRFSGLRRWPDYCLTLINKVFMYWSIIFLIKILLMLKFFSNLNFFGKALLMMLYNKLSFQFNRQC